jgi:hypothetical protein
MKTSAGGDHNARDSDEDDAWVDVEDLAADEPLPTDAPEFQILCEIASDIQKLTPWEIMDDRHLWL